MSISLTSQVRQLKTVVRRLWVFVAVLAALVVGVVAGALTCTDDTSVKTVVFSSAAAFGGALFIFLAIMGALGLLTDQN